MIKVFDLKGQIYMAANAILQPSKFSVSSMAILQQTSNSLRWTFYEILDDIKEAPQHLELIRSIYDGLKVDNQVSDGTSPYPSEDYKNDGMSLEVRYAYGSLIVEFVS
jgi:hypothetical protein